MRIEPSIFKAYDIRGIYPDQLNADGAYAIGRAYATLRLSETGGKELRVAVGSDARLSSPELKARLIEGILDSGVDVDDIGLVSTPTFYFAVARFRYDGGMMVSASHNPKEWNGFKLVRANAIPVSRDSGMHEIRDIVERDAFLPIGPRGVLADRSDMAKTAVEDQLKEAGAAEGAIKPFKIAIDTANGMGAFDLKELFGHLPCEVIWMNEIPDGTFPAHPADPMIPENTADVRKKIADERCDLGIAPDGDGDRYFFFDERGEAVAQEILRGIMAQIELRAHPNAKIVYDVRPGRITKDLIEEAGGRAILAPVGHSLIKEKMIAEDAIFGGESSGHYFYKLPYGSFEAPVILVYKFLAFLSEQNAPLSQLVAPHKKYFNSGEINTRLENRERGLAKLEDIKKKYADGAQSTIDGLSVEYPDYWFNIRLSNTEPLIRLIVESRDQSTMERSRDELLAFISA